MIEILQAEMNFWKRFTICIGIPSGEGLCYLLKNGDGLARVGIWVKEMLFWQLMKLLFNLLSTDKRSLSVPPMINLVIFLALKGRSI